ncbi:NfeD family protein [Rhodopirellula sp. JC639]|uniref:NfeD family protein n=1 Tax=Stieleria mannarensis TaxID=2755585 RepID=UPI00160321C5|nr:NfeD family protein [Rhodopirellula sp. JC639]
MVSLTRIGDRAFSLGPLKPTGQVRLGDAVVAAASTGEWIDSDTEVEVLGRDGDRLTVRPVRDGEPQLTNHGQPLAERRQESKEPIEAPPAWAEKINSVKIGLVIGAITGFVVWLQGAPLSLSALSVPLAGAISGWVFRRLVAIPAEAAGPRSDHRPFANAVAVGVGFTTMVGAFIGFGVSGTFLGTSLGLVVGTAAAGMVIFMLFVFAHL